METVSFHELITCFMLVDTKVFVWLLMVWLTLYNYLVFSQFGYAVFFYFEMFYYSDVLGHQNSGRRHFQMHLLWNENLFFFIPISLKIETALAYKIHVKSFIF